MKMETEFNRPEKLSELGNAAYDVIVKKLGADASSGGCKAFYSPEEWRARGESYGRDSKLIIVHDGGDHARFFNMDYECYSDVESMNEALSKIGCFAEQCAGWYSAVYSNHD